jgi:hypothetical protein
MWRFQRSLWGDDLDAIDRRKLFILNLGYILLAQAQANHRAGDEFPLLRAALPGLRN